MVVGDILGFTCRIGLAIFLLYTGAVDLNDALSFSKWSHTAGKIKSAAIVHVDDAKNPWGHDELKISYQYDVGGKQYRSEQIILGGLLFADNNDLLARHKTSPQNVYYDPSHPDKAVLDTNPNWSSILLRLIFGLLFVPLTQSRKKLERERRMQPFSAGLKNPTKKINWFLLAIVVLLPLSLSQLAAVLVPAWGAHFEFLTLNVLIIVVFSLLGLSTVTNKLVDRDLRSGRFSQAERTLRRVVVIQKAMGPISGDYVKALCQLAKACRLNKKYADAEQFAKEAIAVSVKGGDMLAAAAATETRFASASSSMQNANAVDGKTRGYNFYSMLEAEATQELARIYAAQQDNHNTEVTYERTISLLQTIKEQTTSGQLSRPSTRDQRLSAQVIARLEGKANQTSATCVAMMTDSYDTLTQLYEKQGSTEKLEKSRQQLAKLRREASNEAISSTAIRHFR